MNTKELKEETDVVNLVIAAASDGHVRITPDKHYNVKRLLDRYALAAMREIVPEKITNAKLKPGDVFMGIKQYDPIELAQFLTNDGYNQAIDEILSRIEKLRKEV